MLQGRIFNTSFARTGSICNSNIYRTRHYFKAFVSLILHRLPALCMHAYIELHLRKYLTLSSLISHSEARMARLPKDPSYYILMACTHTHRTHLPNQIHTAVTLRPHPNQHLFFLVIMKSVLAGGAGLIAIQLIPVRRYWGKVGGEVLSCRLPATERPSISGMRSKLFQIIWERKARSNPFYFLDALTMFSVTLLASSKKVGTAKDQLDKLPN